MKTKSAFIYIVIAICISFNTTVNAQAVNVQDSLALVDLYNSTDGPHWYYHNNWLTGPVKTWSGINNISQTRVTDIDLNGNNLNGSIPSSLGNLTKLEVLQLSNNQLSDSIPSSLGNLTNLQYCGLDGNQLSGNIPASLGNLTNLQTLSLGSNHLNGSIPSSFGNLTNLDELNLLYNQLSGSIPSSLGNLVNLGTLYLQNNQLSGTIPSSLGNLTKLEVLWLSENQLSGSIPSSLGNLVNLPSLYLNNNQLSGSIPSSFGNLSNLRHLYLQNNQLSGTIPSSLGNLMNFQSISLDRNQFTFDGMELVAQKFLGAVYAPQALIPVYKTNNTFYVSVGGTPSNNTFYWYKDGVLDSTIIADSTYTPATSGHYDVAVTNKVAIQLALYSDGSLTLPFSDSAALVDLYNSTNGANWTHHDNWLTGPISTWYGIGITGTRVSSIYLRNNHLVGHIPTSIGNLINLQTLWLDRNDLSGDIPSSIGNLSNLFGLYLANNEFTFKGMELIAQKFPFATYAPQALIPMHKINNTFYVSVGGTPSNNTFYWYKDGVLKATIIADSTFNPAISGHYTVKVTNKVAKQLTLYSDSSSILPLTLLDFTATKNGKVNVLLWSTSHELNTGHFNIQRSSNKLDFSNIGVVYANNEADIINQYQFTDRIPFAGANYYRLQIVDKDGYRKYSDVRIIKDDIAAALIHPVPANNVLYVEINGNTSFSMIDQSGRILLTTSINGKGTINVSRLNGGIYFLRNNSTRKAQKVVIVNKE